jgi:hypothetical protein
LTVAYFSWYLDGNFLVAVGDPFTSAAGSTESYPIVVGNLLKWSAQWSWCSHLLTCFNLHVSFISVDNKNPNKASSYIPRYVEVKQPQCHSSRSKKNDCINDVQHFIFCCILDIFIFYSIENNTSDRGRKRSKSCHMWLFFHSFIDLNWWIMFLSTLVTVAIS